MKVVNPKLVVFQGGLGRKENNFSRVHNLMFTSYEDNDCFIISKLV